MGISVNTRLYERMQTCRTVHQGTDTSKKFIAVHLERYVVRLGEERPGDVERRHGTELVRCMDETLIAKDTPFFLPKEGSESRLYFRADELSDCTFVHIFAGNNADPTSNFDETSV